MRKKVLDLRLPRDEQARINTSFVRNFYSAIGTDYAHRLRDLYNQGRHKDIVETPMPNPHTYTDKISFRDDYLAWNFLRKNDDLITGIDTEQVAIDKMELSESICAATNRRWRGLMGFSHHELHLISQVQAKIFSIIGYKPDAERFYACSSWGPGATLDIKSRSASSFRKYRDEHGITHDALNFLLPAWDGFMPKLAGRIFSIQPGDKVITVRKDATTKRIIKSQPGWNVYHQKGFGSIIREDLRNFGLDLNEKAVLDNQDRARRGSLNGFWSTTDLVSASDRLATEPLRIVLPDPWFKALDALRCKQSLSGRRWNGFSAMGNGFTFELETLLFYAISIVVCQRHGYNKSFVSVFGDDIVTPAAVQRSLQEALNLFGFEVNTKKTFSSGGFRESCGDHYYEGLSCKPYYHKDSIRSVEDIYKAYNGVMRLADRGSYRDCRFQNVLRSLRRSVPKGLRYSVPSTFGDIGFHSSFDEACPTLVSKRLTGGILTYRFPGIVRRPIRWTTDEPELLLVRLTEMSDLPRHNYVDVKQRTYISVKKYVSTSDWPDYGPWL